MSEQNNGLAQPGKKWFCCMCGKTAKDSFGQESGWDESCLLNCIEIDETQDGPSPEQMQAFHEERDRHLKEMMSFSIVDQLKFDLTFVGPPTASQKELSDLAQKAIDRMEQEATNPFRIIPPLN